MTQTFAAKAALTVSRATLGLALGTLTFSAALAQEAARDATQTLPNLTVRGSREELREALSPGSVSVVYPDDYKGEHASLPELLDKVPGVYVRRVNGTGQYTTASVRGSAASQVSVYVDGVLMNLASEAAADLSTIPVDNVERIEVYRGYIPARFSGAPIGGVINIVTKKPKGVSGEVSGGGGSFGQRDAHVTLTTPFLGGDLLIGANGDRSRGNFKYPYLYVKDLKDIPNTTSTANKLKQMPVDRKRLYNDYKKANFLLKYQNQDWSFKTDYNSMDRHMPNALNTYDINALLQDMTTLPSGIPAANLASNNKDRRQMIGQSNTVLGWRHDFGDLELGASVNYMDQLKRYRRYNSGALAGNYPGQYWSKFHTKRLGADVNAAYKLGDGWAFDQLIEFHGDTSKEEMDAEASSTASTGFMPRYERRHNHLQLQDTITMNALDGLQVTPIVRADRVSAFPYTNDRYDIAGMDVGWKPTWGVNVKKQVGEDWTVRSSYGTYNRYVNFYELFGDGVFLRANTGTDARFPPVQRETGRQFDVGVDWNGALTDDLNGSVSVNYFERTPRHLMTLFYTAAEPMYVDGGSARVHGAELEARLNYKQFADLTFSATRQEAWWMQNKSSVYTQRDDRKMQNVPPLLLNSRLTFHAVDNTVHPYVGVNHTGKIYLYDDLYEESLTTWDAGLRWDIFDGVQLSTGVTDIFNSGPKQELIPASTLYRSQTGKYYDISKNVYYPRQGRTFHAAVAWKF